MIVLTHYNNIIHTSALLNKTHIQRHIGNLTMQEKSVHFCVGKLFKESIQCYLIGTIRQLFSSQCVCFTRGGGGGGSCKLRFTALNKACSLHIANIDKLQNQG